MEFWLAAGGMTLVVAALLLLALMRRRGPEPVPGSEDVQVYRDQLKEIGRDLERGTIPAEEGERLRTEVSRRLLEADRQLAAARPAREAPSTATAVIALALVVVFAAAVMLYQRLGAPGYPDLPIAERLADARAAMANRPDQAAAEKQVPPVPAPQNVDPAFLQLMEKLRKAVADRPEDVTGHRLLAENELRLGNFHAAWVAQGEVVRLKAATATAQDYADLADMMILAAGGYVSPEAETALKEALKRDPKNGVARFYAGLMFGQNGRPDLTFQLWKPLLDEGPADAPWIAPIRGQIEAVAAAAGVRYSLPPATGANGPSAADVAAAQNMTPEERQQMIRGMVAQLADRLDSQGGSAAEWARLIGAYGVLGETEKRDAAIARARTLFTGKPEDLAAIEAAAAGAPAPAPPPAPGPQAAPLPGPTAGDVSAAAGMTPEERQQMIAGMVGKLAGRLNAEGGSAAEWARLIGAYGVLGETEKARAAWEAAKAAYAGKAGDLATIDAAAGAAGLSP